MLSTNIITIHYMKDIESPEKLTRMVLFLRNDETDDTVERQRIENISAFVIGEICDIWQINHLIESDMQK